LNASSRKDVTAGNTGLFINPIRETNSQYALNYDPNTSEITYSNSLTGPTGAMGSIVFSGGGSFPIIFERTIDFTANTYFSQGNGLSHSNIHTYLPNSILTSIYIEAVNNVTSNSLFILYKNDVAIKTITMNLDNSNAFENNLSYSFDKGDKLAFSFGENGGGGGGFRATLIFQTLGIVGPKGDDGTNYLSLSSPNLTSDYNINPSSTNTYSLGTSSNKWKDIYATNITATDFNTLSDYRIKENVKLLDTQFKVDYLNPVTYINNQTQKQDIGLIAHELQEIYPELVNGVKDGPVLQSINYIGLIPVLINEMKILKQTVKDLQEKLENKGIL